MTFSAHYEPCIVVGQVGSNLKEPLPRLVRVVRKGPSEALLYKVLRTLLIPHLSVKESEKFRGDGAVDLCPIRLH